MHFVSLWNELSRTHWKLFVNSSDVGWFFFLPGLLCLVRFRRLLWFIICSCQIRAIKENNFTSFRANLSVFIWDVCDLFFLRLSTDRDAVIDGIEEAGWNFWNTFGVCISHSCITKGLDCDVTMQLWPKCIAFKIFVPSISSVPLPITLESSGIPRKVHLRGQITAWSTSWPTDVQIGSKKLLFR